MQIPIAEIIAAFVILLSAAIGACRGLVMMVYSTVRLLLVLTLAILIVPLLLPVIPADFEVREGAAFVLAVLLSLIILAVIAHLLRIVDHIPVLRTVNKLGGFLIGAAFGVIIVWLALYIIGSFEDSPWCQQAAEYVQESPLLTQFQKINPITYVMQFFS